MSEDLFPKPARRMRQPAKCVLRQQLALAAEAQILAALRADECERAAQAVVGELPKPMGPPPVMSTTPARAVLDTAPPPGSFVLIDSQRAPWWRRLFWRSA